VDRKAFETLRELPGKLVRDDIEFKPLAKASPNLVVEPIPVENDLGWDLRLNATYRPSILAVTYNFAVRGIGPICRLDVNGRIHPGAGRTHKHDLLLESDPARNLPHAVARPDLEGKTLRAIWEILCEQAAINHVGAFIDPGESTT